MTGNEARRGTNGSKPGR
jgi:hypothetical protein